MFDRLTSDLHRIRLQGCWESPRHDFSGGGVAECDADQVCARLELQIAGTLSNGRPADVTGPSVRFAVKMLFFSGRVYLQPAVLQPGKVMAALR